jgi:hypothetical protein
MQRTAKDNILEQDKRWMQWLKGCSKRIGKSGKTLLQEYAATSTGEFTETLADLREFRCGDWVFLRGPLSDVEIVNARARYLSQYVFVAGMHSSEVFVDSCLAIEDAQIRIRLDKHMAPQCENCAVLHLTIKRMQAALSARQIRDNDDVQLAALVSIYQRYYITGSSYSTLRRDVRQTLERVMRVEFHPDERLTGSSNVWRRFSRDVFHNRVIHGGFTCRLRATPLTREDTDVDPEQDDIVHHHHSAAQGHTLQGTQ